MSKENKADTLDKAQAAEPDIVPHGGENGKKARGSAPVDIIPKKEKPERTFGKEKLLKSPRYRDRRDILNALLPDNAVCTIAEAEKIIKNYMKGKVN